jgi:segregation and condensation protein A
MSRVMDEGLFALSRSAEDVEADDALILDLDGYEGPLHLLLDLARRQKVDLAKISILKLAEQYLAFVSDARKRRLDLAADYLLMASWLAYLKSRLLLPKPKSAKDDEPEGEELASWLTFRLQRLEAMRQSADALFGGRLLGRDVFVRGDPQTPVVLRKPVWDADLLGLMRAFAEQTVRAAAARPHSVHRLAVYPLDSARKRLSDAVRTHPDWTTLGALRPHDLEDDVPERSVSASLFSAALELTKEGKVDLRQDAPFHDVYVRGANRSAVKTQEAGQ